ncbi:9713_t:CDS:2, partial [Paraglomus occultum]
KFPLRNWSHKHFFEYTKLHKLTKVTNLWYRDLAIVRALPGSPVDKELYLEIVGRKMADEHIVNEKKRKYAADEVHTESVTISAELLKDSFVHHKKYTKQRLDATEYMTTPTPIPAVTVSAATTSGWNKSDDESSDSDDTDILDVKNISFDQFVDDEDFVQEKLLLDHLVDNNKDNVKDNIYMFQGKDICSKFASYRSKALEIGQTSGLLISADYQEILSLSHILLLQANSFSDLQIQTFSRNILEGLWEKLNDTYMTEKKLSTCIKTVFREYVEIALNKNLGLKEVKKTIKTSYTKTFTDPNDEKMFDTMQFIFSQLARNIPVRPFDDLLSEGTLTANIISPVLRAFFHNVTIHPTIWPNTASQSAKIRKLANLDASRAKQPDMVGVVVNSNKIHSEMMFGEITGEGKNNNIKKNNLDLIRLGVFMKDALDANIQRTGSECVEFAWQVIVTKWTAYIMVLVAAGLYVMIEIGQTELPRSFRTCGQFIDTIDALLTFTAKYEEEVKKFHDKINEEKEDSGSNVKVSALCRPTLGTPVFQQLIKRK